MELIAGDKARLKCKILVTDNEGKKKTKKISEIVHIEKVENGYAHVRSKFGVHYVLLKHLYKDQ